MNQFANPDYEPEPEDDDEDIIEVQLPQPTNDMEADAVLRRLKYHQDKIVNFRQQYEAAMRDLQDQYERRIKTHTSTCNFYQSLLENTLLAIMNTTGEKKRKYLSGTIRYRQMPEKINVPEDFKAADHKGEPFIKEVVTFSVDKAGIKKAVKEMGEIPAWAKIERDPDKFEIIFD